MSKAKLPGFLGDLDEKTRESVFQEMRNITDDATRKAEKHRKTQPKFGEVLIGSSDMDSFFESEMGFEFVSNLNKGESPESARDKAIAYGREMVSKWNDTGKKSRMAVSSKSELDRAEKSLDEVAWRNYRRVIRAIEKYES